MFKIKQTADKPADHKGIFANVVGVRHETTPPPAIEAGLMPPARVGDTAALQFQALEKT